ncbi:MAG: DUF2272 domain-containing protein [Acidimicrobiia bacterium]|nr:DUF2272 domain-containing protein [Acidimicrobiia bacterium]
MYDCRVNATLAAALALVPLAGAAAFAQQPSVHVRGGPGSMTVQPRPCRVLPTGETRRRIVDLAAQEWASFGFRIAEPREGGDDDRAPETPEERRRRRPRLPPDEAARVAPSIGGYWAVTPQGSWIVARQNDRWNGEDGVAARWNAPWSAAFVSWVMCEAGLGTDAQFRRAIAHHAYIDQAIRARDDRAPEAAFVAYDPGEAVIAPGDMLCSSRRPAYRTLAERRRQMGIGARSHCDIVVKVDEPGRRVFAIGGNVRGVVSLKNFPAVRDAGRQLRVDTGDEERPIFAHLKLRAAPIDANALDTSPAMRARDTR